MRFITFLAAVILLALPMAPAGAQTAGQDAIPAKRLTLLPDTDLPGHDLQSRFNSSFEACEAACMADAQCLALTFNQRNNACFLKSEATEMSPYDGALSATAFTADPATLTLAGARAAELGAILGEADITRAYEFARDVGKDYRPGDWTLPQLDDAIDRARGGDRETLQLYLGAALTLSDRADLFTDYAQVMLETAADDPRDASARSRARQAAVAAYLRAARDSERVAALLVLAQALELDRSTDRIVAVLRLAERISPREDVLAALEDAQGKYGFRITDSSVESDLPSPRICATFSEDVIAGGADYASYVSLDQGEPVVTSEWRRICVEGLSHGQTVQVTFRAGLPAASGESLARPVTLRYYVRDRSPQISFPGRGYVLPAAGASALPITGVNAPEVTLRLSRMTDRNLVRAVQNGYLDAPLRGYEEEYFLESMGEELWTGTATLSVELNREVTTQLPLEEVLSGLEPGIYLLSARITGTDDWDNPPATQWFVVSDLGLASISGNDGLHVFTRSLASAEVLEGVRLQLLSRANTVLGEVSSDAQGHARFDAGLARGTGSAEPAMLVASLGDDLSFLPLTEPEFDLSDRGVSGHEAPGPIDLFLTTDRGIYRAGETVNVTALARDSRAAAITGLPMVAVLTRPDGVEYSRTLAKGERAGGYVFALPVAASAPRGTWRLDLYSDPEAPPLASQRLLVEDFLPERIDFDLTLPEGMLAATQAVPLGVDARYLFGAPGAGLQVNGQVTLRQVATLADWPGWQFGRHDQQVYPAGDSLPGGVVTDERGHAQMGVSLPELPEATGPLEAEFVVQVAEGSGRPVERRTTRTVAPAAPVIGIAPQFAGGEVPEGATARFRLIALSPALEPAPMRVKWTLNRVRSDWRWFQQWGEWQWEEMTRRERVAEGEAMLGAEPVEIGAQVGWGRYELRVERLDGAYVSASTGFSAGWYVSGDAAVTPDTLELSLDAPRYRPGEVATLRLVPRFAGKALVTVLSDRLIQMQVADVAEGENLIAVPVTEDWGAGAYVTATVIRPMDTPAGQMPARALGLSHAAVDPGKRQLQVAVEVAPETAPRGPLPVAVRVEGLQEGETGFVTLAAVDEGILNLTGFAAPDPSDHYFGQRKLGVGLRDLYGRLIDAGQGVPGQVRSGGDAQMQLSMQDPPGEELVAFFSGPVEVGPDGLAHAGFDLPAFNGNVKLMAVAWSPTGVGQAEAETLVRDPVVVTASLPRFAAPGDRSRLLLELVHATGPAGAMALEVSATGLRLDGALPAEVTLTDGGRTTLALPFTALETGVAGLQVVLTTPDGRRLEKSLNLPVEANDPLISRTSQFTLAAGQVFTLDDNIFAGLRRGSASATVAAGPIALMDAPGLLAALDRYPYTCTEQMASMAMPLLYMGDLAQSMGLQGAQDLPATLRRSVTAVLANQSSSGGFGLWYPTDGDGWLDAYVTDFLGRARKAGVEVPELAFRQSVNRLRNTVNYYADFDDGGEDLAYALYVLAREGAAAIGDLRYYADQKAEAFATPMARAQLGAALALYGDPTRADRMFRLAAAALPEGGELGSEGPFWRADYGTGLRDAAAVLTLAVESGSQAVDREALAARVAAPQQRRALSPQEAVWSLLATHALTDEGAAAGLTLNGAPVEGPLVEVVEAPTAGGLAMAIGNDGPRETLLTVTALGVPEVAEPAGGDGYAITREYYTLDGTPADPAQVRAGTRLVAVLTVQPFGSGGARLMVNDPLPAGFEIDNPSLLRSGDIGTLSWLDLNARPERTEFRQERFLAAVEWQSDDSFRLAYILRAVSPGEYHHPAASVEDMYRPQFRAHTSSGSVRVTE